jgi:hypothetical protein
MKPMCDIKLFLKHLSLQPFFLRQLLLLQISSVLKTSPMYIGPLLIKTTQLNKLFAASKIAFPNNEILLMENSLVSLENFIPILGLLPDRTLSVAILPILVLNILTTVTFICR